MLHLRAAAILQQGQQTVPWQLATCVTPQTQSPVGIAHFRERQIGRHSREEALGGREAVDCYPQEEDGLPLLAGLLKQSTCLATAVATSATVCSSRCFRAPGPRRPRLARRAGVRAVQDAFLVRLQRTVFDSAAHGSWSSFHHRWSLE
jgi:hypothetical protein